MTAFGTLAFRCSIPVLLLCLVLFPGSVRAEVDYSRDILPILADRCFSCHGADGRPGSGWMCGSRLLPSARVFALSWRAGQRRVPW